MLKYFARRLLGMIPMLLLISVLVFFALELTPLDPVSYLISPDAAVSTENLEALREKLGLNDNVVVRYFRWMGNILRGDFGYSIVSGDPIGRIIALKLPATMELALLALLVSTVLGVGLGIIAAIRQNGIVDYVARFVSVLGISIPQFFFGICIIWVFAVTLGWLPAGGRIAYGSETFWDRLPYLVLLVMTMVLSMMCALTRYTRNSMLDVMSKDYVKTARSKGLPEWQVYIKHVFRNSMRPVLTVLCFRLPMLIGGSVVIESLFAWHGIGTVVLSSVTAGDYPVIMMSTLMVAVMILFASFLVDILSAALDPRIRFNK